MPANWYIPGLPVPPPPTFDEEITVTGDDPGPYTNPIFGTPHYIDGPDTGPDVDPDPGRDYPFLGDPDLPPIDAVTDKGTNPFGPEGERRRLKEILELLAGLLGKGAAATNFLEMIAATLGLSGSSDAPIDWLGHQGAANAAQLLGTPHLPIPAPGATQGISFLDWQPERHLSEPASMTGFQLYRPDLVAPPPGLLQSLLADLMRRQGIGPPAGGDRPQTPPALSPASGSPGRVPLPGERLGGAGRIQQRWVY